MTTNTPTSDCQPAGLTVQEGTIVSLQNGKATVRTAPLGCGSCASKGSCGSAQGKPLSVPQEPWMNLGMDVEVSFHTSKILFAIVVMLLLPSIIMVVTALTLSLVQNSQTLVALASLLSGALYYSVLAVLERMRGKRYTPHVAPSAHTPNFSKEII